MALRATFRNLVEICVLLRLIAHQEKEWKPHALACFDANRAFLPLPQNGVAIRPRAVL